MKAISLYEFCINNEKMKYILDEWDYEENEGLSPDNIAMSAITRVHWKCKHGHKWKSSIHHRIYVETDCPYCTNKKLMSGFNDLATKYPELAKEWNYDKNELGPDSYFPTSLTKVWWRCELGHEWEATIKARISGRNGITKCPYCSNKKVLPGFNDLATTHPHVANEWNYERNILTPQEVIRGSNKKVWWKCRCGHEWETAVEKRTRYPNPTKCPACNPRWGCR